MQDKKTLLYVDDEPLNLMLFSKLMAPHFEVLTASSGAEALELLEQNPHIRVIISDMKMPKMDGLEFVNKAKAEYNHRPYMIISGYDMDNRVQDAIKEGLVAKYMQKPYDVPLILNEVKKALAS
jgi:CheY-like chemotaxis protein